MAFVDYGALLRVDGKLINKNGPMFMETSDTGYICSTAVGKYGEEDIYGNYFVYAGDGHFLLAFYKGVYKIISDGQILYSSWGINFTSETHYFDDLPDVKVSYLDKEFRYEVTESWGQWEDYVKEHWVGATGKEKNSELEGGKKEYKRFRKHAKKVGYVKKHPSYWYKERPYRFLAEWKYKGHTYEVIFGYGIENDMEVWNKIKYQYYGFSEMERNIIDSWFLEEEETK